jgi:oxalate decarboxylase
MDMYLMNQKLLDNKFFGLAVKHKIAITSTPNTGSVYLVDKTNFPALENITCYSLEVWEACMRLPHWHPNCSELGYVVSGSIQVIIWRSPGESAVFNLTAGMCWFIPKAALHSLNNIGHEPAKLLVGFSSDIPKDIDLPLAFQGIPIPLREAMTSPHSELKQWLGPNMNPLVGHYSVDFTLKKTMSGSPYGFDLAKVTPLFNDPKLGSVVWGVQSNWNILQEISVLRAILKPGVARDPIWYPDVGTLYVVAKGTGEFIIITSGYENKLFKINSNDYIFVPMGVLHSFSNNANEDLEMIAYFSNENPQPEVSLSVATAFFPNAIRKSALTQYGETKEDADPLKYIKNTEVSPYLLRIYS